jgi:hypothetical protein
MRLEGISCIEIPNDLIGIRTHDLPACSIVHQLRYRVSTVLSAVKYIELNVK